MILNLWEGITLAGAGLASGALNAAAGGGSLVTFPVLLATGYSPIIANVTNNVAAFPGYLGGGWGYRHGLKGQRTRLIPLMVVSAIGSFIGVALVLVSSQSAFERIVPFLVLAACGLLVAQPYVDKLSGRRGKQDARLPGPEALVAQFVASIYGGYFGAALGVAVLALLAISIKDTLQRLNALKALLQIASGGVAAVGFTALAPVAWEAVVIIAPASVVGGLLGARLAQRVNDRTLRIVIVSYGIAAAIWLLLR